MASPGVRQNGGRDKRSPSRKTPPISQYLRNVANWCGSLTLRQWKRSLPRLSRPRSPHAGQTRQPGQSPPLAQRQIRYRDGARNCAASDGANGRRGVLATPRSAAQGRGKPRRAGSLGPYWRGPQPLPTRDRRPGGRGRKRMGGAVADNSGLLVVREDTIIKGEVRNCRQIEVFG